MSSVAAEPTGRLRQAVVLRTTEDVCTVFADDKRTEIPYAAAFPRPRADRVTPGHLVAVADAADGSPVVVWRWFDAVVLDVGGRTVSLWEPFHGTVRAEPRDPQQIYPPGSRAYLSAGLPGAEWWVAGPVVNHAEDAAVDLHEVEQFLIEVGVMV